MLQTQVEVIWLLLLLALATAVSDWPLQVPFGESLQATKNVTIELFDELEELSRIVDIAYCVGTAGLGIYKPFLCASRCQDFPHFELVKTWHTGPLLSDSCGYVALSHRPSAPRIIVAFRGTYSIANTIIDLSTVPQEYIPYPGDDSDGEERNGIRSWRHLFAKSLNPVESKCNGCMVHAGFMTSWRHTRPQLLDTVKSLVDEYPDYRLTLVGHSLGGAVAALASLDFHAKGWKPQVTTFGEPRVGNQALAKYLDTAFFNRSQTNASDGYRRVTHVDDPVPLLPLSEWGYRMHGGEVYIAKPDLPPDKDDLHFCEGDNDPRCIAGSKTLSNSPGADTESFKKRWLESNGFLRVPARFGIWRLFFAHRDYFWRLGLCVPAADP